MRSAWTRRSFETSSGFIRGRPIVFPRVCECHLTLVDAGQDGPANFSTLVALRIGNERRIFVETDMPATATMRVPLAAVAVRRVVIGCLDLNFHVPVPWFELARWLVVRALHSRKRDVRNLRLPSTDQDRMCAGIPRIQNRHNRRSALSIFLAIVVGIGLAGFPATIMMVCIAVVAPCAIAAALRALVQVHAVAWTQRRYISVAAQEALAGLLSDRKPLSWFFSHRLSSR